MSRRLIIQGTVQGVGFRPLVYRVARELGLAGRVRNTAGAVVADLHGPPEQIDDFELLLRARVDLPAQIAELRREELPADAPPPSDGAFLIEPSDEDGAPALSLAADAATCADCLAEIRDPADRRHGYPFNNCTRCGPRYTITRALPYDRPQTTMARFEMCQPCAAEYHDPGDRRFHAQPIACPACGPRLTLRLDSPGASPTGAGAVTETRRLLADGAVVAIKGLGGFHLAADARDERAVARIRRDKRRTRKPLAVMLRDLDLARRVVHLEPRDEAALTSPAAPIVIAPAREGHGLSRALAPGLADLGVMLPYTALHHLLLDGALDALVMTSGNAPGEPITTTDEGAQTGLGADAVLTHDRAIEVACDDSVLRTGPRPRGPLVVRRARGCVPGPLDARFLPKRAVLALGAELKVTVTTLARGQLSVGRHLGDLDNPAAEAAFVHEIERMLSFGRVEPEAVAVDLHPDLFGGRHAERRFAGLELVRVQHHHAHLAAVLVEHGVEPGTDVAGVMLDGLGLGEDDTIWGGEVLRGAAYGQLRRIGHLRPIPQPGGDRAARQPWRMAVSLLWDAGLGDGASARLLDRPADELAALAATCPVAGVAPLTSSAGRLFDGVAALLGLAPAEQEYEGEAAARLEAIADPACDDGYPLPVTADGSLDTRALTGALLADPAARSRRAARFINGLADGLAALALGAGCERVALGGGCLINRRLLGRLARQIEAGGARPLWPRALPPGDGGLSAGQAAVAACRLAANDGRRS